MKLSIYITKVTRFSLFIYFYRLTICFYNNTPILDPLFNQEKIILVY